MKNVTWENKGTKLIIEVDLSKEFGYSKSGKTISVASTEGNIRIGDFRVGLNVYKYPNAKSLKDQSFEGLI